MTVVPKESQLRYTGKEGRVSYIFIDRIFLKLKHFTEYNTTNF